MLIISSEFFFLISVFKYSLNCQLIPRYSGLPGSSMVKNLRVRQEIWAPSLGQEDPLVKEMATHSSILV